MKSWLVRWRLALRIARREALRHRGRTALVVAMVGLPILAIVGGDTLYRTSDVTPVEALTSTLGAADVRISGEARSRVWPDPVTGAVWEDSAPQAEPPWSFADVADVLPEGSRLVEAVSGETGYRTPSGYAQVRAWADDLADPMRAGAAEVVEGRFAEAEGEVAVSPLVASRGIAVGDELAVTRDEVPVRVVGIVRSFEEAGPLLLLPSAARDLVDDRHSTFFASVPGGLEWSGVSALNERGLVAISRDVVTDPPPVEEWAPPSGAPGGSIISPEAMAVLALIVASLILEVVLLAGPAFAVGVRRQRRDLALVAATGGGPADLRRIVLASGVVLAGGGAVLGAVLGIGFAAAAVPLIESRSDIRFGPFEVSVLDALLTVAAGVVAGLAATYVPARQAARADVVDALAGRRGQVRSSWRLPVVGLLLAAAGVVLVVLGAQGDEFGVAGGAVLLIAGLVVATPWLVGLLEPLARLLPVAGRLAVRDATRHRSRTAPAVAAVMATVAGVTALAIGTASDSAQSRRDYTALAPMGAALIDGGLDEQGWADVETALHMQAPERPVHRMQGAPWAEGGQRDLGVVEVGCSGGLERCRWYPVEAGNTATTHGDLLVADAATLRALDAGGLPEAALRAVEDGRVAVLGEGAVDGGGTVTLAGGEHDGVDASPVAGSVTLPAVEVPLPAGKQVLVPALVLVPPVLTERLPVPVTTAGLVTGGPDDPVTPAQEQELTERLGALSPSMSVYVERGWSDDLALARLLLTLVGGALVLIATLTATGLALTDARPDFATLAAIGAAPRTRRFMAMGSAAMVAGAGAVLGLLAGLGPGIAVAVPLTSNDLGMEGDPVLDIPWTVLGAVAVVVPLLAVGATGLFVRSRLPMGTRLT